MLLMYVATPVMLLMYVPDALKLEVGARYSLDWQSGVMHHFRCQCAGGNWVLTYLLGAVYLMGCQSVLINLTYSQSFQWLFQAAAVGSGAAAAPEVSRWWSPAQGLLLHYDDRRVLFSKKL